VATEALEVQQNQTVVNLLGNLDYHKRAKGFETTRRLWTAKTDQTDNKPESTSQRHMLERSVPPVLLL